MARHTNNKKNKSVLSITNRFAALAVLEPETPTHTPSSEHEATSTMVAGQDDDVMGDEQNYFAFFSRFPQEIQDIVWEYATSQLAIHFLDFYAMSAHKHDRTFNQTQVPFFDFKDTEQPIQIRQDCESTSDFLPLTLAMHNLILDQRHLYDSSNTRELPLRRLALTVPQLNPELKASSGYFANDLRLASVNSKVREKMQFDRELRFTPDRKENHTANIRLPVHGGVMADDQSGQEIVIDRDTDILCLLQPPKVPQAWCTLGVFHRTWPKDPSTGTWREPDKDILGKFNNLQRLALPWDRETTPRECIGCKQLYAHYRDMKAAYYRHANEAWENHKRGIKEECAMYNSFDDRMRRAGLDPDSDRESDSEKAEE
ncbi:hypothetical protein B0H66DRAFT_595293 [Apodospora peruviana]|uniref:Uncharacterized protein n=1 Tax=Apodospora peruviana TaxID=516989 RepID=A0AAE0HTU9_9PEZI|nr:hypothetical protein B0H66DRAFT_595293 [Apodospora peruviana]